MCRPDMTTPEGRAGLRARQASAGIADLSPTGKRLEARASLLNTWHKLLHVHDHLDLNDPESSAIAEVTTLIADKLQELEGRRPRRR